jgi:hypothetical protein
MGFPGERRVKRRPRDRAQRRPRARRRRGRTPAAILLRWTQVHDIVPDAVAPAAPGDYFEARFDVEEDELVFRRIAGRENWLDVLKACPVSPDDVPQRSASTLPHLTSVP